MTGVSHFGYISFLGFSFEQIMIYSRYNVILMMMVMMHLIVIMLLLQISLIFSYKSHDASFPLQNAMKSFLMKIVDLMKDENLFASQGGPIILAQVIDQYSISIY